MTRTFSRKKSSLTQTPATPPKSSTTPNSAKEPSAVHWQSDIIPAALPRQLTPLRSDVLGALNIVLENAPYGPNVEEAKVRTRQVNTRRNNPSLRLQTVNLSTLLNILNTTKSADIPNVIKGLSQDGQDTLMKYLYKGMAMPGGGDINWSILLGWHEKVRSGPLFHSKRSSALL